MTTTFKLRIASEDVNGDRDDETLHLAVSSQDELSRLVRSIGGGVLVLEGSSMGTLQIGDLMDGGAYTLVGGTRSTQAASSPFTTPSSRGGG